MGDSVFGIALSGLSAARAGLSTISHNISNANTDGYSRQNIVQDTANPQFFGAGFFGQGVEVSAVRRSYSDFLGAQLNQASSDSSYFTAFDSQMKRVDMLMSDQSSNLEVPLQEFFASVQDLSTNPSDGAGRQNVLSTMAAVSNRFNALNGALSDLRQSTNQQVQGTMTTVNQITSQIVDLNKQIVISSNQGNGATPPNDLMDKRDQLIKELSGLVQTTVVKQGDGAVNVFLGNGQPIVVKDKQFELVAQRDPQNTEDLVIGLKINSNNSSDSTILFSPSDLGSGTLAGFLQFRQGPLSEYQNKLGLMAAQFATKVNQINSAGFDQTGVAGANLFDITGGTRVISNSNNTGSGDITLTGIDYSQLNGGDYEFSVIGGVLKSRTLGSGSDYSNVTQVSAGPPEQYDLGNGLTFNLTGTKNEGDHFVIMPTRDAAKDIQLTVTDPVKIAAAKVTGSSGDNSNLLDLANLQTTAVLYQGTSGSTGYSISSAFSQLVSSVGNKAREISMANDSKKSVLDQTLAAQQDVSGVNLDEEAANLLKYQQAYQASGRVISLSKELFDLMISITGR